MIVWLLILILGFIAVQKPVIHWLFDTFYRHPRGMTCRYDHRPPRSNGDYR